MALDPARRPAPVPLLVALAAAALIAASQVQWGIMRVSQLSSWTPRQVEWVMAALALVGLVVCGPLVRRFQVPDPPRPTYDRAGRLGVTGWGLVGLVLIAPAAGWAVGVLFVMPVRKPLRGAAGRSVAEIFLDGVVVPALWEEFVWRVVVLAVLVRVTGPRLAVVLQAVSFAVAHTSWSVGFGRVPHSVASEYLLDLAVDVAISGVVFGFLVLELGTVWPAVAAHAAGNIGPMFRDAVPWLSFLATFVALAAGFVSLLLMRRLALVRLRAWLRPPWRPLAIRQA